jgi:hypothetical protein
MTPFGNSTIVDVACGLYFTLVLTLEGEVFMWGTSYSFVSNTPVKIDIPGNRTASLIGAGDNHCLMHCTDGTVWAFGMYIYLLYSVILY